jgi:hypothetical protein
MYGELTENLNPYGLMFPVLYKMPLYLFFKFVYMSFGNKSSYQFQTNPTYSTEFERVGPFATIDDVKTQLAFC